MEILDTVLKCVKKVIAKVLSALRQFPRGNDSALRLGWFDRMPKFIWTAKALGLLNCGWLEVTAKATSFGKITAKCFVA